MIKFFNSVFICLSLYYIFVISGVNLSIPIQVIPDETAQLLNIYGMIQNQSLVLPYESYYTVWVHLSLLPFTIIYWTLEYIFQGMPDYVLFKKYVASNYMDVLPFLRAVSTLFFIISTWLVSRVVKNYWGFFASRLFILFVLADLLIFINLHYSKHWIIDISWVFISIYLYWRYLTSRNIYLLIGAIFTFCIGVYSSHPLVVAGLYPLYMLNSAKLNRNLVLRDLFVFFIIFLIFFATTIYFGSGKIIGEIVSGGSTGQMSIKPFLVPRFFSSLFDYNPLLLIIFLSSLIVGLIKRKLYLLLSIPFFGYLLLISTFHYEPRYSLFLVISMALVSAISVSEIKLLKLRAVLISVFVLFNMFLLVSWHFIAIQKDTRTIALEWVLENSNEKSFVIYNTVGFNYFPLSTEGIEFIENNFPKAIGTREKLHLSLELNDGMHGLILRKIDEGGYDGHKFIASLINSGYEPILLNERYGFDAYFFQPSPSKYKQILKNCDYDIKAKILPYRGNQIPDDFEKFGDILYNFTSVFDSLRIFDRPGPILTIYQFQNKQPETCI